MSLTPKEPSERNWKKGIEARLRRLETRRSLGQSTIGAGGTLNVDGALDVAGELNVGGNMAVTGTLSLPAGIIDNDALAHPAAATAWHDEKHAFTIATSLTNYLTHTIVPPSSRYTTAAVTLIGNGQASLSSGVTSGRIFLSPAIVNGSQNVNLGYLPEQSASAAFATAALSVTIAGVLTDVPSTGFDVTLDAEVTGGFDSGSGNVSLSAVVIWLP